MLRSSSLAEEIVLKLADLVMPALVMATFHGMTLHPTDLFVSTMQAFGEPQGGSRPCSFRGARGSYLQC